MSNRNNLQAAIDEDDRKRRALMADAYNLDCSISVRDIASMMTPLGIEEAKAHRAMYNLPPAPTYPVADDSGQRLRRSDKPAEKVSDPVNKGIDATLDERGSRYGQFTGHAAITQGLKSVMKATPKWAALQPDQKEALEMVQHKIGRILNGDPDYHDSWHDIVGYAKLVADRLQGVQR